MAGFLRISCSNGACVNSRTPVRCVQKKELQKVWGGKGTVGDLGTSVDTPRCVVRTRLHEIPEVPVLRKD